MTRIRQLSYLLLALSVTAAAPAFADSYLVFTEGGIPVPTAQNRTTQLWTWCNQGQPCATELQVCGSPEGIASLKADAGGAAPAWSGLGVFLNTLGSIAGDPPVDLSAFTDGDLRFWIKTPDSSIGDFNLKAEIQCKPSGTVETYTRSITEWFSSGGTFGEDYGWDGTSAWQEIAIPLASFFNPDPLDAACLGSMVSPFMITIENLPFFSSFFVDYVRWQSPNSHSGASSVQLQGRQLLVDGEPFVINGVAYSPISVGENWQGAWVDRPDRYLVDFPLIAESGANAIRLYAPLLSTPMLDAAWAQGLYVIPNFGVVPGQLTCPTGRDYMRDQFVEVVNDWKDHPAILMWLVGNEVNTNLGTADLCTDWYTQLDSLAAAAHAAEGGSFHPVGTATAELGDICVAGCSDDITLPNVDYWGTQIYRGCSFTTAFTEYSGKANCDRPLILTEFGADAYDTVLGAESQSMQSDCLDSLLDEANQALAVRTPGGVSSGQVIFEWIDEWWKADEICGTGWDVHDGCASFQNFAYPDPGINEEWWGIVSQVDQDPDARGLRTAFTTVQDSWWQLGPVLDLRVVSHDPGNGSTTLSFDPAAGADDHTVYYGPLAGLPSYGYTGSSTVDGSNSVTLPSGSLFWVVVGRTNGAEGCYGSDSACAERPPFSGAGIPQSANRTCSVPGCP